LRKTPGLADFSSKKLLFKIKHLHLHPQMCVLGSMQVKPLQWPTTHEKTVFLFSACAWAGKFRKEPDAG
jgi:hypothetical protein